MPKATIENINQGGLSDSLFSGYPNSLYKAVGLDVHSEPGVIKVNQAMANIATAVDELCNVAVPASNGKSYWFSADSGKIWEIDGEVVTLVHTTTPAFGEAKCLGGREYHGYIYWATELRLHRIAVTDLTNWALVEEDWQTFSNGDVLFHPMIEQNLVLYIGDGNYVAQVDYDADPISPTYLDHVFTENALDLEPPLRVSALGKIGTDVLVGTYISDEINKCDLYRWNTFSPSFSVSLTLNTNGIYAFIETPDVIVIQAGLAGSLYRYNGEYIRYWRKIPGTYDKDNQSKVKHNSTAMFRENLSLFAPSVVLGNSGNYGIYSFGSATDSYNSVLMLEFPLSVRDENDFPELDYLEIGAIIVMGADVYASWRYQDGINTYVGIDRLDYTQKVNKAYFETMRMLNDDRTVQTMYEACFVGYHSLPAGTEIDVKYKADYQQDWENVDMIKDDVHKMMSSDGLGVQSSVLQLRFELLASANDAPEIEQVIVQIGG